MEHRWPFTPLMKNKSSELPKNLRPGTQCKKIQHWTWLEKILGVINKTLARDEAVSLQTRVPYTRFRHIRIHAAVINKKLTKPSTEPPTRAKHQRTANATTVNITYTFTSITQSTTHTLQQHRDFTKYASLPHKHKSLNLRNAAGEREREGGPTQENKQCARRRTNLGFQLCHPRRRETHTPRRTTRINQP